MRANPLLLGCVGIVVLFLLVGSLSKVDATRYFKDPTNLWNADVSTWAKHPDSDNIMSFIVANGGFDAQGNKLRIDFSNIVNFAYADTPRYPFVKSSSYYEGECDDTLPSGNTFPLPVGGGIEGASTPTYTGCSGDCHVLVVHRDERKIYEAYEANFDGTKFTASCVVVWNMCSTYGVAGRGEQCTSVDAGGLSFTAGVVTQEEVAMGNIDHAMRFILANSMIGKGTGGRDYVHPANHLGGPQSTNPHAPLYGTRFRLKASVDTSGLPKSLQTICNALKKYGTILTDGDSSPAFSLVFQIDGYSQYTWDSLGVWQRVLSDNGITASTFEVVQPQDYPTVIHYTGDCHRLPVPTDTCTYLPKRNSCGWSPQCDVILQLTNQKRTASGLPLLTCNSKLTSAAKTHTQDMITNNYYSHTGLDGSTPQSRVTTAGYAYSKVGENIAAGSKDPAKVMSQWIASPTNLALINDATFKEIGCGYGYGASTTSKYYWTVVYAAPKTTRSFEDQEAGTALEGKPILIFEPDNSTIIN